MHFATMLLARILIVAGAAGLVWLLWRAIRKGEVQSARSRIPFYRKDDPIRYWRNTMGLAICAIAAVVLAIAVNVKRDLF